jgi:hypothetical protein
MKMRAWPIFLLALSGCGPRAAELPADPVQKAATCGVVAAANARRTSGNVEAKLTIEQQGSILHHALLAGAESGSFDQSRAAAVVNAMPGLGDKVTSGKWEPLVAQCQAAYPATKAAGPVELPADPLRAQAGCQELGGFITNALRASEADFPDRMRAYDAMRRGLDAKLGATARARGLSQVQADDARNRAMAELIRLGPPTAVLDACVERFGS